MVTQILEAFSFAVFKNNFKSKGKDMRHVSTDEVVTDNSSSIGKALSTSRMDFRHR